MIHPIRAWNRFFFRPISARPLGAIRILFGLLALANLAFCAVDLDYWYTDAGLLRGDEAWVIAGPLQFSPLHFFQDPTSVRIAFALTATAAVLPHDRLADEADEHPLLSRDALDPQPQPGQLQRGRRPAADLRLQPDAQPLRGRLLGRRLARVEEARAPWPSP